MRLPLFVDRNSVALPGRTIEKVLSKAQTAYLNELESNSGTILFAFDQRYSSQPLSPETIATVGTIGEVVSDESAAKAASRIQIRIMRRVALYNVRLEESILDAEFRELPEVRSGTDVELQLVTTAKGLLAAYLREQKSPSSSWTHLIGTTEDPIHLAYLMLGLTQYRKANFSSVVKFTVFDEQKVLEVDPAEAKLSLIIGEFNRAGMTAESAAFDPADPLWQEPENDVLPQFKDLGQIDSDGAICIGCPGELQRDKGAKYCVRVPAASGVWSVFQTQIGNRSIYPDDSELDGDFNWRTFVISQERPAADWTEKIQRAKEYSVNVETGVIIAAASNAKFDYEDIQEYLDHDQGVHTTLDDATSMPIRFLQISTAGDGKFPVRLIKDAAGSLTMAIVLVEVE